MRAGVKVVAERVERRGFQFGRQFRRVPYRADLALSAGAVAFAQAHARERKPAHRARWFSAEEAMHRDGVAPLPPQARLRAPVQQRNARPLRIGADEGGVALESGFAIGWRSSAHSTSFRATGSPIDEARP
jgi:hypothetical protein